MAFPSDSVVKSPPVIARDARVVGPIPQGDPEGRMAPDCSIPACAIPRAIRRSLAGYSPLSRKESGRTEHNTPTPPLFKYLSILR